MTPERHQQICDLLYQVLELQPNQRDSFLEQACRTDHDLRREVDVLLSGNDELRSSFLRLSTVRLLGPGTRLGDFEIESMIGSGGMSEVYRARDLQLPRQVAIKVISSYLAADQKQLRRFEQEARAAAAINHPNILTVFHVGKHEDVPYLVSELLEGETIRERLRSGRIPLAQTLEWATQAARGLAAAHEKGIVHRDLKPENLFVTKHGQVKILDFGLAKLTQDLDPAPNADGSPQHSILRTEPGVIMGTTGYMSPEQARGQLTDARSDVFSFGAVLYEMITGKPAFQRQTKADSISSVLNQQPPALTKTVRGTPAALQRVISRCLEKQPERRYQDASELVTALQALPRTYSVPLTKVVALALVFIVLVCSYLFRDRLRAFVQARWPNPSPQPHELVERNLTANPADNPIRAATVTRDGKYVAYTDNSDKVNQLEVDSGNVRPFALDSSYEPDDWFPDGVHLLVSKPGQPGLWKFSSWDSSLRKIFDATLFGVPVISPDGSTIVFANGEHPNEIWSMGAEGETPHKIMESDPRDFVESLTWSSNGGRLAYVRLRGTYDKHESVIETCDLKGRDRNVVLSEPKLLGRDNVMIGMAWLADGRLVYPVSTRLDEYNLWSVVVRADGRPVSDPQPVTHWQDFMAARVQPTADGKRLIVLKQHSENSVYIGTLPEKSRAFNPTRLTKDNWLNVGTSWTPDGKNILLYSQRNGSYAIRRQSIDGSTAETLVSGPENYRDPVVGPAGTMLYSAFSSTGGVVDSASWRLMSMPLAGGAKTVLLNGRYSYACATTSFFCVMSELQPNRQLIFFALDPSKGKAGELARVDDQDANGVREVWRLSADGRRIAIINKAEPSDSIRILNLEDKRVTAWPLPQTQFVIDLAWAADGKSLFLSTLLGSSVVIASANSNGRLTTLYKAGTERTLFSLPIVSPDGHSLAFTQTSFVSDLVLLENF